MVYLDRDITISEGKTAIAQLKDEDGNTFTNNISKNIKKELEDFLDILVMSVIDDNESKYLKQFKMKFTEKYGENREINLLELMDEHMGL